MNKLLTFVVVLSILSAVLLAGCSTKTDTTAISGGEASDMLIIDEELGIKNLMLMGIYGLQGSDYPLSAEQASTLATLWQAYKSVTTSGTSSTSETEALITQMQSLLTPDQIAAINAMDLGAEDLVTFYASVGIEMPTPAPGETPNVPGSGAGQNMTEEEKAARREANGDDGGSSRSTVVMDKVIEYLLAAS